MNKKNAIILITGASGFIGSHLIDRLTKDGVKIIGISRRRKKNRKNLKWRIGNLTDEAFVSKVLKDINPDVIVHLASRVTGDRSVNQVSPVFKDTLVSTVNLLTEAVKQKVKKVILTGSMEEPENINSNVVSPYSAAKGAQFWYAKMFSQLYFLPIIYLKLFMVYGPNQSDENKLIPYTIQTLCKGNSPVYTDGKRLIDWIYVDDVIEAYIKAINKELKTTKFLSVDIGTGQMYSIRSVVMKIAQILKYHQKIKFGTMKNRKMDKVSYANINEATKQLSFTSNTSLNNGLKQTINWYRDKLN